MSLAKIFALNIFLLVSICNVHSQEVTIKEQPASVSLCEVKLNPELYLNKEVIVDAVYEFGFEIAYLIEPDSCMEQKYKITYKFDEKFKELTEKKVLRKFYKLLNKQGTGTGEPQKVRGLYTVKIEPFEKTNPNDRRFEFQIRIMNLVSIGRNI